MTRANEVAQFFINLANAGMGVDKDGAYGYQCADVSTFAAKKWFGVDLWGNAIDLIKSAKQAGWQVFYLPTNERPKAGDFFVMNFFAGGINYGHTGVVIADSDGETMRTVEQNIDGNWDSLQVGGPARFNTRNISNAVGWFRPPYQNGGTPATIKPTSKEMELTLETGTFTVGASPINVRRAPSLKSEIVATYRPGEAIKYDSKGSANGFRWISYIGGSGIRNYLAIGQTDAAGKRISLWGSLK